MVYGNGKQTAGFDVGFGTPSGILWVRNAQWSYMFHGLWAVWVPIFSGWWLSLPLWKKMEWKSVGMMKFPKIQYMDSHKIHVPNHQPVLTGWCFDSWRMMFWLRSSPPDPYSIKFPWSLATSLLNYRLSWPIASLAHAIAAIATKCY